MLAWAVQERWQLRLEEKQRQRQLTRGQPDLPPTPPTPPPAPSAKRRDDKPQREDKPKKEKHTQQRKEGPKKADKADKQRDKPSHKDKDKHKGKDKEALAKTNKHHRKHKSADKHPKPTKEGTKQPQPLEQPPEQQQGKAPTKREQRWQQRLEHERLEEAAATLGLPEDSSAAMLRAVHDAWMQVYDTGKPLHNTAADTHSHSPSRLERHPCATCRLTHVCALDRCHAPQPRHMT